MMRPVQRILCFAVVLLTLTIPVVLWGRWPHRETLSPIPLDALICDVGRFAIDEDHFLDIQRRETNEIVIRVFVQPKTRLFKGEPYPTFHTGTRFNEEWFVAKDCYNRIWIYVGDSPHGRQVPSVFMDGHSIDKMGKLITVTDQVSISGNWAGVPQIFLSRIHASSNAFSNPAPRLSPPLTEDQQIQLAMATENRR